MPSLGLFEKHAQTELHQLAVKEVSREQVTHEHLPIVFVSIFEHNSNLLPWRETGAQIELIPMTDDGNFDYAFYEKRLIDLSSKKCLKIGCFSAGSNITGNIFDTDYLAMLSHKFGALAVFDYAAVGSYVEINMNGISKHRPFSHELKDKELCYKDAIFLSPHKMVGGPGSSGILLTKK